MMPSDRRSQMLQAAFDIAVSEGLEGIHARSVAKIVGVNHAAVHYYFPRRPDLLQAMAVWAFGNITGLLTSRLYQANGPRQRIAAHFVHASDLCRSSSGQGSLWASLVVASRTDETLRAEIVRQLREWTVTLQLDLDDLKATEPTIGGPFADAELLVATFVGLMVQGTVLNGSFRAQEKIEALQREILG